MFSERRALNSVWRVPVACEIVHQRHKQEQQTCFVMFAVMFQFEHRVRNVLLIPGGTEDVCGSMRQITGRTPLHPTCIFEQQRGRRNTLDRCKENP